MSINTLLYGLWAAKSSCWNLTISKCSWELYSPYVIIHSSQHCSQHRLHSKNEVKTLHCTPYSFTFTKAFLWLWVGVGRGGGRGSTKMQMWSKVTWELLRLDESNIRGNSANTSNHAGEDRREHQTLLAALAVFVSTKKGITFPKLKK